MRRSDPHLRDLKEGCHTASAGGCIYIWLSEFWCWTGSSGECSCVCAFSSMGKGMSGSLTQLLYPSLSKKCWHIGHSLTICFLYETFYTHALWTHTVTSSSHKYPTKSFVQTPNILPLLSIISPGGLISSASRLQREDCATSMWYQTCLSIKGITGSLAYV